MAIGFEHCTGDMAGHELPEHLFSAFAGAIGKIAIARLATKSGTTFMAISSQFRTANAILERMRRMTIPPIASQFNGIDAVSTFPRLVRTRRGQPMNRDDREANRYFEAGLLVAGLAGLSS